MENRENQNYSRTRVQFVHAFKVESSVEFNRLHRESQFHLPDNCVFAGGANWTAMTDFHD